MCTKQGCPPSACVERGHQYVWRIEDGRARYICYRFFTHPNTTTLPPLAGVRNRLSEYGLEVILIVAFLHYWIGISLDHTCAVVEFFHGFSAEQVAGELALDTAES